MGSNLNLLQTQKNKTQGTPTLSQVIDGHIKDFASRLHVSMPGQVVKFYIDGTADVQPLFIRQYFNLPQPTPYKPIPKVPVIFPGPGNGWLRFPLQPGDPVALFFSDRSLDKWWSEGGQGVPSDRRMFHLSDAFCIPGLRSNPQKITPNGDPMSMELAFGSAWLEITAGGKFKLKNGSTDSKTLLHDILNVVAFATAPPGGGPLIFTPPNDPTTVGAEIDSLFA